jgi:uncharacterized protein
LEKLVHERMQGDPAHDFAHCERVAVWTIRLGWAEVQGESGGGAKAGFSVGAAVAAAYLHDWVNLPKNSPDRARASEMSACEARRILESFEFDGAEIEDVCNAVRTHSFSRGESPVSLLGRCLQDADRLEALGALGIFRTLVTGVRMGAGLIAWNDPWAQARPLDDRAYSVDHFFTKLLKLRFGFTTQAGRREADRRTMALWRFLQDLRDEGGVSAPPVLIREAFAEDDQEVGELLVDAFVENYARKLPKVVVGEERRRDLRAVSARRALGARGDACVLVAEVDGRIAGTATLFRGQSRNYAWTDDSAELRYMAVHREFQGAGISRALLDEARRRAMTWGVSSICLHVRQGATGVMQMYERNGYVKTPEGDRDLRPEIFLEAFQLRI